MITDKFHNGFLVSKDKLAPGAASDVHFEPLSKGQYKSDGLLCRKWEKVMHHFCNIVCSKLGDSVQF
jgi:hypothetical protein